jgi:hypothetical protein
MTLMCLFIISNKLLFLFEVVMVHYSKLVQGIQVLHFFLNLLLLGQKQRESSVILLYFLVNDELQVQPLSASAMFVNVYNFKGLVHISRP